MTFFANRAPGDWKSELAEHRRERDVEFRNSPVSPMAGVQRLTVSPGVKAFIAMKNNRIDILDAEIPEAQMILYPENETWTWKALKPGIVCRAGDKEIASDSPLPLRALFRVGRLTLQTTPFGKRLVIQVFDPETPEMVKFRGLVFFSPDPAFAVKARLERFTTVETVKIPTRIQLEKTFYRYARIHFTLGGKEVQLTAYKSSLEGEEAKMLFIPFSDLTTSKETYYAGRFLDVEDPGATEFILDFNRCYNPLCNYSDIYNCPIPPAENALSVAIRAGEKNYPRAH